MVRQASRLRRSVLGAALFVGLSATPALACVTNSDCDDGLFCTGTETCVLLVCVPGLPPDCGDGILCTVDSCNEATDSCDHTASDALCSDGFYCNGEESCDAALGCQDEADPDCDDSVGCTDDACNELTDSCDHDPDDSACDDGLFLQRPGDVRCRQRLRGWERPRLQRRRGVYHRRVQ